MSSDPTYNINVTGDIKQMLEELGTEKGKQTALLGGGGSKAQKERAAALATILAARSRIKEDSESNSNGEVRSQTYSTAARIAMHMAGERAPVNAKMVSFLC